MTPKYFGGDVIESNRGNIFYDGLQSTQQDVRRAIKTGGITQPRAILSSRLYTSAIAEVYDLLGGVARGELLREVAVHFCKDSIRPPCS